MAIDLDRCTGCQSCVVACSVENNQPLGSPEEAAMGRVIRWLKILPSTEARAGRVRQSLIPMPCQHCDDPPCTRVCPTSATFTSPDGTVGQVYDRCIGCRYCVNACPYTCKFFNWGEPRWPSEVEPPFNPDVSVRYKGVVEKCLFCNHRLQRAKEKAREEGRELREGDYVPACKAACPAQAIAFGDMNDPGSAVSRLAASPRAFKMLEDLGTHPKVIYLKEG
ncbi:MAG: 4Fe-4S dicluster domain-containing protein [Elusimicrobia bacterium]|nr:4Fe-4S dicluster domain-containing protein [Elusimicrobiota bacterium]